MVNLFKQHLAFYLGAITIAALTFTLATSYGESSLKAPRDINGIYKIESTTLPDCLSGQSVQLLIQQSGIYLNAALIPTGEKLKPKVAGLTGSWKEPKLSLVGQALDIEACRAFPPPVKIEAQISNKILTGTIALNNSANFTAQLVVSENLPEKSTEH